MKSISLPRLYALTDLALARRRSHPEIVRDLLDGGCRCIQIREKSLPDHLFFEQLVQCVALCRGTQALLIVNDRVDLAWAAGASGVHLGQDDLPPQQARRVLGSEVLLGRSTHSLDQARLAEDDPAVDYVAIGPIFSTSTKISSNPPLGISELQAVRRAVRKPLVAIGGITADRAPEALAAGCDAVAVVSALMGAPSIAGSTREWVRLLGSP